MQGLKGGKLYLYAKPVLKVDTYFQVLASNLIGLNFNIKAKFVKL
jgi:hypothetical protein